MSHTQLSHTPSRRDLAASLRGSRTRKHARLRHRLLQAERLEDRRLLSLSPLDSIPVLNSNPTAAASIYLDFNGHYQAAWSSYSNITTPAYDIDGDATTFSDEELANIHTIWETVAEDYSPFNINVTTVEPSVLAPGVPIDNANKVAMRVAIGAEVGGWTGGGLGGIAQYNSFTNSLPNVVYVFTQLGINNPSYTPAQFGNTASHEAGHSFGLYHNQPVGTVALMSTSAGLTYAWANWSFGEKSPGVFQDDMAVLANTTNGFGFRSDDVSDTPGSATGLTETGNTWSGAGIVGSNTDVDVFSFHVTTEDTYRMDVNGVPVVSNLDVALELRNSAGQLIASSNPQETRDAEIVTGLTAGDYYVSVMSSGLYSRIGQYSVSVDVPQAAILVTTPTPALTTGEDGRQASFSVVLHTQPLADVIVAVQSNKTAEGTVSASSLTFTPANWDVAQTVTITGVNDTITDGDVTYSIVLAPAVSADPDYQGINPGDVAVVNLDNEPIATKFYVVNDASQNHTYEYNNSGMAIESYTLNSGNTAPRGAASTIAGTKTWVVDANRKVYVYNNSGGLLGSWTAGTLASNATVEGIATNGTDVWIVDAKSDKVYKYTGAASRLSGSQNAASSFSLNSSNINPKDIVTDGTSLWVVDDSTFDRVFKYTVTGSLAGTLTIAGGGSPTGITLDPANVSNLWIVDSATDRVYQYDAAAPRTSGSQAPSVSFALAAGNTNPQGIADPPAPSSLLATETPVLTEPATAEATLRGNDAALENMYYEPLKKVRVDTVRRSESRTVESPTRDLSYTVGASTNRIADDSRWARANHHQAEVDDLFAQWDSDPLELFSFPNLGM
jgi:hypothetical protein